ncbi:unnamed protein product [Staurois parvus]|uniref:Uncharacterized protein n=1 Tax=Staurois parvus TaxID=386267 RepID=A0ABN9C5I6_9NEOB|nr:unnamed protein product [Staurois parvus]
MCPDDLCNPSSTTCQCSSMPHFSAYQYISMPPISAHLSCHQCHPTVPVSATQQCSSQCHPTVPVSATQQCHI